jgi:8-oxo-dGTP pyrophosphatase MutT (NUDIX family)
MRREKRIVRTAKKGKPVRQVATIPIRLDKDGKIQVLLITSKKNTRFIVPKGWPMKGKNGRKAAMTEAHEEAGVVGKALEKPIGSYSYWKRLSTRFVLVNVTVYLMPVFETLPSWEESTKRKRAWLSPAQAARLIDEPQLATLVRTISAEVSGIS